MRLGKICGREDEEIAGQGWGEEGQVKVCACTRGSGEIGRLGRLPWDWGTHGRAWGWCWVA